MKANLATLVLNAPTVVRVALVLVSLIAMAMGSGAPDDWGYSGWSIRAR